MSRTSNTAIRVKGLKQLDRALGKADKRLRNDLRRKLRNIAGDVAETARDIVASKGLVQSGDLRASIQPFALTGRAGVRATATHRGYAYPSRLEYENRAGEVYGPNAFLNPAVDRRIDDVTRSMEGLLDDIANDFEGA